MIKKIKRILLSIIYQSEPSFIISYRYLLPFTTSNIKTHRGIFLFNFRRLDLAIINIFASIRWIGYKAWLISFKICKNITDDELSKTGNSNRLVLFVRLLRIGLFNFISPYYYFKYKLYENKKPLDFFYYKENSMLHLYSDRKIKNSKKHRVFISDKYAFLDFLEKENIQKKFSSKKKLSELISEQNTIFQERIFCKPNTGNQSLGAMTISYDQSEKEYKAFTLVDKKEILGKENIIDFIKEVYGSNDILVERFIEEDSDLKDMSKHPTDSSTMRIITVKDKSGIEDELGVIYIQLEIPLVELKNERQYYYILPLNIDTLDIDLTQMPYSDDEKLKSFKITDNLKAKIKNSIKTCIDIHRKIDLRSIAFDIIISSEPIILEANYCWDIGLLYQIFTPNDGQNHAAEKWLKTI